MKEYTIYHLNYNEDDTEYVQWSVNKEDLEKQLRVWKSKGFSTDNDSIEKLTFTNVEQLVEILNFFEEGRNE